MPVGGKSTFATRSATWPGMVAALLSAALLAAPWSASAQELRAVGQFMSRGPVTSETSTKIVSRLRALVETFQLTGITRNNAATVDAAGRFSSMTLKVDQGGRVQNRSYRTGEEASLDE